MIYLVILGSVFIVCHVIITSLYLKEQEKLRDEFAKERQILLNRIQDPHYKPPLTSGEKQANFDEIRRLQEENEAFGLIGKIVD